MKSTRVPSALVAAAAITVGLAGAPVASADVVTTTLGDQADLVDGEVIQGWTVSDLKASTDEIPFTVRGTLWEATASDEAIQGNVTPIVSNLNARADNGETYRVLFGVATPQGVNPATLAQGQATKGKVYFDVTGDSPDSVVYNSGGDDRLLWEQPPAQPRRTSPVPARNAATPAPARNTVTPAPARSNTTPAAAAEPAAAPAAIGDTPPAVIAGEAPLTAGSQGTPLPEGPAGAPVPAGSQGTPLPESAEGTPLAEGAAPAAIPEGSEGTPLPENTAAAPVPAGSQGTPLPEGTPVAPLPDSAHGTPRTDGALETPLPEADPVRAGIQETLVPTTTPVPLP